MFPGVILQMTYWYRPDEMSIRLLYFCECTPTYPSTGGLLSGGDILGNLSGVFSGILAFAFDSISGARGLSGWQWLFLSEGLFTVVFGIAVKFILPDCQLPPPSSQPVHPV